MPLAGLPDQIEAYRKDYAAYYDRCKHDDSPALRDPNAVVYLVPGVGMIAGSRLSRNGFSTSMSLLGGITI